MGRGCKLGGQWRCFGEGGEIMKNCCVFVKEGMFVGIPYGCQQKMNVGFGEGR